MEALSQQKITEWNLFTDFTLFKNFLRLNSAQHTCFAPRPFAAQTEYGLGHRFKWCTRKNPYTWSVRIFSYGAANRTWTGDLVLTKDVLYLLSHSSMLRFLEIELIKAGRSSSHALWLYYNAHQKSITFYGFLKNFCKFVWRGVIHMTLPA